MRYFYITLWFEFQSGLEGHTGSLAGGSIGLESSLLLETEHSREDVGGEAADGLVVFLHRFVEILTADGNTIFRAFELSLKFREILVGLQVGIILRQSEEAAKGLGEFALCRLELGQLLGRGVRRVNGNLRGLAAGSKSSAASIESMAGRWC